MYYVFIDEIQYAIKKEDLKKEEQIPLYGVLNGPERYYIQSSYRIENEEKMMQEQRPLLATKDCFKKIIITDSRRKISYDEKGIIYMGLYDFLLDKDSLNH